mgnify:CR=1
MSSANLPIKQTCLENKYLNALTKSLIEIISK